ncbi:S8 family peptidase [Candidatus Uabimicrobium amorphum]|uniref:Subtilisin E n=1 Tax=Uabimicrobium amorphum TaxID=2596890 RepID=A0A5S9IQ79_UABAM|nr:S8 family serine peptidase [Candidatus Uabimicrobium amorphum]BBM86068.1 subtilisin E [Candidatus Uabimicrobium amorphum]
MRNLILITILSLLSSIFAAELGPKLQEALEGDAQSFDVVIELKEKLNGKKIRRAVRRALRGNNNIREEVINRLRKRSERAQRSLRALISKLTNNEARYLWAVNSISLELSRDAITELAAHPKVESIELNIVQQFLEPEEVNQVKFKRRSGKRELTVPGARRAGKNRRNKRNKRNRRNRRNRNNNNNENVSGLAVNEAVPGFDSFNTYGLEVTQSDDVNNILGITGKGVIVAVLDTGIQSNHSEFANPAKDKDGNNISRFVTGASFVPGEADPEQDGNNHGTHCAGTVAGATAGVAIDAQLMAVKVLGANGSGSGIGIIQGIQFAVANGADVISMSLGTNGDTPGVNGIEQAANNAVASGAVLVAAAGNSGPTERTVGNPGSSPIVISVGAHDSRGDLANFSSRGPNADNQDIPTLMAPGVGVRSAIANGGFAFFSGTSMATPHVAGIAALMLEVLKPALADGTFQLPEGETQTSFLKGIFTKPENVFGVAQRNATGAGAINAFTSVSELVTLLTPPEPEPEPEPEPQAADFTQEKLINDFIPVLQEVYGNNIRFFRFFLNAPVEINEEERTATMRLGVQRFVVVNGRFVRRQANLTLNFTLEHSNPEAPVEEAVFNWVLDDQGRQALENTRNL